MKLHLTQYLLATAIIIGTLLSSCNKDKEEDPKAPTEASGIYATYSYGSEYNNRTAILWKDGVETKLTNYKEVSEAYYERTNMFTSSVVVTPQNDVYVAGCECLKYEGGFYGTTFDCYTVLWKNGFKRRINENVIPKWYIGSKETGLHIASNGDVYIMGVEGTESKTTVWKNDSRIFTKDIEGEITDFFVKGDDVYISGNSYDFSTNEYYSILWKNGVEQKLPTNSYMATSVCVSDHNDVYVGLHNGKVLKNNVEYPLNTHITDDIPDIVASGNDIYVLATFSDVTKAGIWKNGEFFQELEFDRAINNIYPSSLFIKGDDIYAIGVVNHTGGSSSTGLNTVVIWKNGKVYEKLRQIDGLTLEAPSIFVK